MIFFFACSLRLFTVSRSSLGSTQKEDKVNAAGMHWDGEQFQFSLFCF